ncbi:hypothetical protein Pelo_19580 [Pelomyxa schiedti]|nr:hypothetical protein Pelo_19580 [Pelomyxa schiedti]
MYGRPTTRTHQSVTIPGLGRTTIGAVVDVRSQFVAFASSSIERCGLGSAAKLVSHNRALCESFGRDWVVGCCRQAQIINYEKKQYSNLGDYPCSSDVVDICIHDTKTATLLAFLTIERNLFEIYWPAQGVLLIVSIASCVPVMV